MPSSYSRIEITPRLREALELCGVLPYHSNLHSSWYGIKNYDQYNTNFSKLQVLCIFFCLFCGHRLRRKLPSRVVDGVVPRQDQLTDGQHGVAVVDEIFQNTRQRLRCVECRVMEQHNAARLHPGRHPLIDGVGIVVLPVERIPIGNDLKPLRRKGLQVLPLCASSKKLTCKWGVWRVIQAREGSNSRGLREGGWWLKDGGGCGILISSQRTFCIRRKKSTIDWEIVLF